MAEGSSLQGTKSHYEVIVIGAGVAGIYQIKRLADLGDRRDRARRGRPTSAAPGTGTAIPAAASTPRATPTATRSPRNCSTSGTGRSGSPASRRTCATSTTSPTSSTCASTCSSTARSRRRTSTRRTICGGCKIGDGRELTCRFVVMALGLLSAPTLPRLEGMDSFKGRSFHTFHWPHEPVELAGKKVAVIGTGATGIQVIGEIADKVGELTVFQRRPNWSAPLNNGPISDAGDGRHPLALRRDLRGLRAHARRLRARARPPRLLRGDARGAAGAVGQALRRARLRHLAAQFPRDLHRRGGQRRVLRIHRRPHPPARQGSRGRREADPARPRLRRAARAAGDQLFRGLQPRQRASGRYQRDADRAHHRDGPAHHRRATTSSTSSSMPPASTPSPAPIDHIDIRGVGGEKLRDKWKRRRRRPSSACSSTAFRTC